MLSIRELNKVKESKMSIALGSDHNGFILKKLIEEHLKALGKDNNLVQRGGSLR
jgi:thiamine biosynthesis lipoprotein ApbE